MNKKETAQLLFITKANYPKFYKNITQAEIEDMVAVWHMCLKDYEYSLAQAGLKIFLTSDREGFPPSVGQIIDCIQKITGSGEQSLTELTAWGIVYRAICNANYNADAEFGRMPDVIKKSVGSPAMLREWAQLPVREVNTVIQSNFMRAFKCVQKREKELRTMPSEIRKMIEESFGEDRSPKQINAGE